MKRYDKYKDSGVEWIGEVPSHWSICKIKHLSRVFGRIGFRGYNQTDLVSEGEGAITLSPSNMQNGKMNYDKCSYLSWYKYNESPEIIIENGDILFVKTGSTYGKVSYVDHLPMEATINPQIVVFKNVKGNNKYLFYLLSNEIVQGQVSLTVGGSTIPTLSQESILNYMVPVAPPKEQTTIANYLDKKCSEIDNVISAQQKRIALLQELKQSVITHAVTKGLNPNVEMKDSGVEWIGKVPKHWEVYKIKNCCKTEQYSIKTGPFGTQLKGEDLQPQGDVAVYSQQNVINNDFTKVRYFVSSKKAETLKGFYTHPNDVLITSRGTIGKAAILSPSFPTGILHPCLIALRLKQEICLNDWLVMYINETDCFKTDVTLSSNATTIDVIYTGTLKNIYIPVPPHDEQLEILRSIKARCTSIDSSISKAQHQVELLQEYKQSLITEVVTGKRKVC